MKVVYYTLSLLVALSFFVAGEAQAKHASEKARSRVLKELHYLNS